MLTSWLRRKDEAPLTQKPNQGKRIDQNQLGEGQFFGHKDGGFEAPFERPGTSHSVRSVVRPSTATGRPVVNSPYLHLDLHNFASASMTNLPGPASKHVRKASYSSLRSVATGGGGGAKPFRFGNGSSTSLVGPAAIMAGQLSMNGSRPGTPTGVSKTGKAWVNPLDVHFCRPTDTSAPPKSPLGMFDSSVDHMRDDVDQNGAGPSSRGPHDYVTAGGSGGGSMSPPHSYPSPPRSGGGAERQFPGDGGMGSSSGPRNGPQAANMTNGAARQANGYGPSGLPSPTGSLAMADGRNHGRRPYQQANGAANGDGDDHWGAPPVIQNVLAKRDTMTINAPKRHSVDLHIEDGRSGMSADVHDTDTRDLWLDEYERAAAEVAAGFVSLDAHDSSTPNGTGNDRQRANGVDLNGNRPSRPKNAAGLHPGTGSGGRYEGNGYAPDDRPAQGWLQQGRPSPPQMNDNGGLSPRSPPQMNGNGGPSPRPSPQMNGNGGPPPRPPPPMNGNGGPPPRPPHPSDLENRPYNGPIHNGYGNAVGHGYHGPRSGPIGPPPGPRRPPPQHQYEDMARQRQEQRSGVDDGESRQHEREPQFREPNWASNRGEPLTTRDYGRFDFELDNASSTNANKANSLGPVASGAASVASSSYETSGFRLSDYARSDDGPASPQRNNGPASPPRSNGPASPSRNNGPVSPPRNYMNGIGSDGDMNRGRARERDDWDNGPASPGFAMDRDVRRDDFAAPSRRSPPQDSHDMNWPLGPEPVVVTGSGPDPGPGPGPAPARQDYYHENQHDNHANGGYDHYDGGPHGYPHQPPQRSPRDHQFPDDRGPRGYGNGPPPWMGSRPESPSGPRWGPPPQHMRPESPAGGRPPPQGGYMRSESPGPRRGPPPPQMRPESPAVGRPPPPGGYMRPESPAGRRGPPPPHMRSESPARGRLGPPPAHHMQQPPYHNNMEPPRGRQPGPAPGPMHHERLPPPGPPIGPGMHVVRSDSPARHRGPAHLNGMRADMPLRLPPRLGTGTRSESPGPGRRPQTPQTPTQRQPPPAVGMPPHAMPMDGYAPAPPKEQQNGGGQHYMGLPPGLQRPRTAESAHVGGGLAPPPHRPAMPGQAVSYGSPVGDAVGDDYRGKNFF